MAPETTVVLTGWGDEPKRVRIPATEVAKTTNHTPDGPPNNEKWHDWTLYDLGNGLYYVHDVFHNEKGPTVSNLSNKLEPRFVAKYYPRLANLAIEMGIFDEKECVLDIEEAGPDV